MKSLEKFIKSVDWRTSGKWTFLSVVLGVFAGLGGIVFHCVDQTVIHFCLVNIAGYLPEEAAGEHGLFDHSAPVIFSPLKLIGIMIIGGLVSGWLVTTFAPEAQGHGTDAAIDAYHNKRGRISARIPIIKTLASAITLGTGGSGGREGPIAQIAASIGAYIGKVLNLPTHDRRILLAAGMGAGVGAVFRAPLAGALFAAEILYSESDFEAEVIIPAATASIIGYSVFSMWLPESHKNLPLFGKLGQFEAGSPLELFPYGILAVVLVGFGIFYIKFFYGTHKFFEKLPIPKIIRPAIGAGLAGVIGVLMYRYWNNDHRALAVLATGYGTLQNALTNASEVGIPLLLAVAFGKIITTSLTISSGGSGGVFGPSMVIGGCVGAAVGLMFHEIMPTLVPHPEAFAIVGMAGFFSGCAHAPFSTIIMVSELTGGYGLLLPTMWVSTLTFVMGSPWKLYSKQVPTRLESPAHRGDFLVDVLQGIRVKDVFSKNHKLTLIPEAATLDEIVHLIAKTQQHYFPVVNEEQKMIGIFSADDCRSYLYDDTLWKLANARDIMNSKVISLTPEDDLNTAMRCFTSVAIDEIPVVDPNDRGVILGTLRHKETIAAYNRRIMAHKQAIEDQA